MYLLQTKNINPQSCLSTIYKLVPYKYFYNFYVKEITFWYYYYLQGNLP